MKASKIPAAAGTLGVTVLMGLVVGAAATTAEAPEAARVATLDRDEFTERYDCLPVERNQWTRATPLLSKRRAIKTSVYALPGDGTGIIRWKTNKATAAAISFSGDLRLVCTKHVPYGTRVRWS